MVSALLAGTKTQTRRVVKPQPGEDGTALHSTESVQAGVIRKAWKPYALPGDRLWVKETFAPCEAPIRKGHVHYRADGAVGHQISTNGGDVWWERSGHTTGFADLSLLGVWLAPPSKWKPSIFMPRWASRITLEVTGVRVERLQAISEDDAKAEGARPVDFELEGGVGRSTSSYGFRRLWESINGPESWTLNPWVWVVSFRRTS